MSMTKTLYNLFIFLLAVKIDNIACANFGPIRNAIWPYIDSIQFPYPTNDPINITSSEALPVFTPFPLLIINNPFQPAIIKNTGSDLIVTSSKPQFANITGGVLFKDLYTFFLSEYFWDNSLSGRAANYINGVGTSLKVVTSYYNTKYGNYDNAKNKRDGIVRTSYCINVLEAIDNVFFYPLQSALRKVLKAGSSINFPAIVDYYWFLLTPSFTNYYYANPGDYYDPISGKVFYSSTTITIIMTPPAYISVKQFEATFGSLENKAGKLYSHTAKVFPKGERPLRVAFGVISKFVF